MYFGLPGHGWRSSRLPSPGRDQWGKRVGRGRWCAWPTTKKNLLLQQPGFFRGVGRGRGLGAGAGDDGTFLGGVPAEHAVLGEGPPSLRGGGVDPAVGGEGGGRDGGPSWASLGTAADRAGVRGGAIGRAQGHDTAVRVAEEVHRLGVVHVAMDRLFSEITPSSGIVTLGTRAAESFFGRRLRTSGSTPLQLGRYNSLQLSPLRALPR